MNVFQSPGYDLDVIGHVKHFVNDRGLEPQEDAPNVVYFFDIIEDRAVSNEPPNVLARSGVSYDPY